MPAALVALILVALAAFAFLPQVRGERSFVTASAASIDKEAMQALDGVCEYLDGRDFYVKTSGEIKAKAFGIPHTQKVSGHRGVKGGEFFEKAESKSSLVKAAVKKTGKDGGVDVSKGEYKKKKFVYGKPKHLTGDEYLTKYGRPSTGLVRYELDGAVLEAKKVKDGVYTYKLDAKRATRYCKNEVKTLVGSKKHPDYKSVSFTLYCDGNRPVKVRSREKFETDICGGITCVATYTEIFDFDNQ